MCGNRSAWSVDSILGELLPKALFLILGIRALLLGKQLRHGRLRRRSLTVKLANAGAAREHYRGVDVRNIRERLICDSDPARQPPSATLALISSVAVQRGFGRTLPQNGRSLNLRPKPPLSGIPKLPTVGEFVEMGNLMAERLAQLIQRVRQNPSYRDKARYFQKVIARTQGLDLAADVIERAFKKNHIGDSSGQRAALSRT